MRSANSGFSGRLGLALFLAAVLGVWLALPRLSSAHAKLIQSDPVSGAVLDDAPEAVKLFFTEDVGLEFSTARLLDRNSKEYEVGNLGHDGSNSASMVVPLPSDLGNGSYTLVWRVVSGIDGHLTLGTVGFHVGPVDPNEAPIGNGTLPLDQSYTSATEAPDPIRWLVRALILAAATLLLGGSVFTILVVEPTAFEQGDSGGTLWKSAGVRFAGIAAIASLVLILGLGFDLLAQVALIAGTDYLGAFGRGDTMLTLLNSTRFGFAWIMKALAGALLLLLMLLVWAFNRRGGSGLWEIGIAAGSLLLLAESLSSHAAAAVNSGQLLGLPVPLISDWLHLVTVAAWVGGLGYMVAVLFPTFGKLKYSPEMRRSFLASSIPRFSRLAIASVVVLAITGTYNLIVHSTDLGAILSSTYGQVLFLKIGLFVALVALGAVNLRRVSPALQNRLLGNAKVNDSATTSVDSGPVVSLWRNIRVESALAALALLCAGGLTLMAPPTEGTVGLAAAAPQPSVLPASNVFSTTQVIAGNYNATLLVKRDDIQDQVSLDMSRNFSAAMPLTDVTSVLLRVTRQDLEEGSTSFEATEITGDTDKISWQATGAIFPLDGQYLVNATVRRTDVDDLRVAFLVVTNGSATSLIATPAIQIRLTTDPSPPISGTIGLSVLLLDGESKPIEGARLSVVARRPASQDAPVAVGLTAVSGTPGVYSDSIELRSKGSWLLMFSVERDGLPTLKSDVSIDVGD